MSSAKKQINILCAEINRRIYAMGYLTESELRDYLDDQVCDDKLLLFDCDTNRIADILGVNENCIHDVLSDNNLLSD